MSEELSADLTQESRERLEEAISTAAFVREMFGTEGMKRIRSRIDTITGRSHSRWLLASKEDAEKIRSEAYGYEMFFSLAKQMSLSGDNAKKILDQRSKAE